MRFSRPGANVIFNHPICGARLISQHFAAGNWLSQPASVCPLANEPARLINPRTGPRHNYASFYSNRFLKRSRGVGARPYNFLSTLSLSHPRILFVSLAIESLTRAHTHSHAPVIGAASKLRDGMAFAASAAALH
jgi:hypothetical protein